MFFDVELTAGTAIKLPALPTQPAQLLQANMQLFFCSGEVKRMHAWILHEEKVVFFMNINEETGSR